jgi:hypothetical protein
MNTTTPKAPACTHRHIPAHQKQAVRALPHGRMPGSNEISKLKIIRSIFIVVRSRKKFGGGGFWPLLVNEDPARLTTSAVSELTQRDFAYQLLSPR